MLLPVRHFNQLDTAYSNINLNGLTINLSFGRSIPAMLFVKWFSILTPKEIFRDSMTGSSLTDRIGNSAFETKFSFIGERNAINLSICSKVHHRRWNSFEILGWSANKKFVIISNKHVIMQRNMMFPVHQAHPKYSCASVISVVMSC